MVTIQRSINSSTEDIVEYIADSNTILELSVIKGSDRIYWQSNKEEKRWATLELNQKLSLISGQKLFFKITNGVAHLAEVKGLL